MSRKMTITLDEDVYDSLRQAVGQGDVSLYIEDLLRAHVHHTDLDLGYEAMASDTDRETQAKEWLSGLAADAANEARW